MSIHRSGIEFICIVSIHRSGIELIARHLSRRDHPLLDIAARTMQKLESLYKQVEM